MTKALAMVMLLLSLAGIGQPHTFYEVCATVTFCDYEQDEVLVIDDDGNIWAWSGVEDWMVWDRAVLVMDDPGTPNNPEDDVIIRALYDGFVNPFEEGWF